MHLNTDFGDERYSADDTRARQRHRGVDIKRDENRGDFLDEVTEDTEKNCVDKTSWQSLTRIKTNYTNNQDYKKSLVGLLSWKAHQIKFIFPTVKRYMR